MDNITKNRASPEDLFAYVFSDMHVICVEICSQFVLIFNFTGVEEILIELQVTYDSPILFPYAVFFEIMKDLFGCVHQCLLFSSTYR